MVSQATMTYPSLEEDLECHEKERAHPLEIENFINEHGSYPLILSSSPCSFEKSPTQYFFIPLPNKRFTTPSLLLCPKSLQ